MPILGYMYHSVDKGRGFIGDYEGNSSCRTGVGGEGGILASNIFHGYIASVVMLALDFM